MMMNYFESIVESQVPLKTISAIMTFLTRTKNRETET